MPRYYFHIKHDDQLIRDDEGIVLDDIDAVKGEVVESSREIMGELALQGRFDDGVFVIEDSDGRRVLQFPLKGALWG
ncbi:MAG TPA: hypothetical protein VIG38_07360 [Hyphomicrobium sp.]|jgi:hypothetical protein